MKRLREAATSAVLLLSVVSCSQPAPAGGGGTPTPAPIVVTMGTEPWIGYGPWWIAQKKGYFKAHGLDVRITNFQTDADRNAAVIAGKTDVSNVDTGRTIQFVATLHQGVKVLLLLDASLGADAILATKDITDPSQIVGKKVAYEFGTTSDLLIHYMLRSKGIPFSAIQAVNSPAADAGTLLIAGKVDVAVTYEPYISNALSANGGASGAHVLYSSKDAPGLISDFLTTRTDWLSTHKDAAHRLILAWNDAMNYLASNPTDAIAIMADGVGAKPADLTATLAGVKIYTVAENQSIFQSGELAKEYQGVGDTLTAQGTISAPVPFDQVADFSVQQ